MAVIEGVPLFYLELLLGQFCRQGPLGTWKKVDAKMVGLGYACAAVSFVIGIYYNVLITWCLWYFFRSLINFIQLPWSRCPEIPQEIRSNFSLSSQNVPVAECQQSSPTQYFFYRESLNLSGGIDDLGGFNWRMFIALTISWIIIFLCMIKGIKTSGKVRLSLSYLSFLNLICEDKLFNSEFIFYNFHNIKCF